MNSPLFSLKMIILTGGAFLGLTSTQAATLPLTLNGVDWGTNYYAPNSLTGSGWDGLPGSASPAWGTVSYFNATTLIPEEADYLRINTMYTPGEQGALTFNMAVNWDAAVVTTFEFTMRVVSQDGTFGAGSVLFWNGSYWNNIIIGTDQLSFGGINRSGYDFTEWTTFRITLENMDTADRSASLYINNSPTPVAVLTSFNPSAGTNGYLQFGDGSTDLSENGITDWKGIRWTSEGAYAPIPEPAMLAPLGAGLVGILCISRRRRQK